LLGKLGVLHQICIVGGVVFANLMGFFVNADDNENWRIIFGFPLIILGIQLFLLLFIYTNETPKYLIIKSKFK
jgi:hypothetical protein